MILTTFFIWNQSNAQNCTPILNYNFQNNLNNSGSQGTSLNATVSNGITYSIGKDGSTNSAATFDGLGSKFEIPNTLDFALRTWMFWINASVIDNELRVVFDGDNPYLTNSQTEVVVSKGIDGFNYINYGIGTNRTKSKINPNEWNHIALVKDKTDVKLYFNGCLVFTGVDMSNNHASDGVPNKIIVGRNRNDICQLRSNGPNGNCFQGRLDDLRVYDCALDATIIKSIAGTSCVGDCECGKWVGFNYMTSNSKKGTLKCNQVLVVKQGQSVNINPSYKCVQGCKSKFEGKISNPNNSQLTPISSFPYTFNQTITGDYYIKVHPNCGDKLCLPCVIKIVVIPGCSNEVFNMDDKDVERSNAVWAGEGKG